MRWGPGWKQAAFPARNPRQNLADLRAQIAANEKGVREILGLVDQYSLPTVQAYMQHVQDNAEESVRRVLDVLNDGAFSYTLDSGGGAPGTHRVSTGRAAAPPSTSPARRRSSPTTSMPRRQCAKRPCCMSSAPWSG